MEYLLMMCLGKLYLLNKKAEILEINVKSVTVAQYFKPLKREFVAAFYQCKKVNIHVKYPIGFFVEVLLR